MAKKAVAFPITNTWYLPAFYFANGGTMFGDGTDGAQGIKFGGDNGAAATKYLAAAIASGKLVNDADGAGLADQRNGKVVLTLGKGELQIALRTSRVQKEGDELLVKEPENHNAQHTGGQIDDHLESEGVPLTVDVAASVELGGENARRRDGAKDQKVVYEDELVDDGYARHGLGA